MDVSDRGRGDCGGVSECRQLWGGDSAQGAGEYALSDREVLGFGGASSYDSTLNGKVLDLAIREAVDRLVEGVEQGKWKPAK